mmetsp:Transcript_24427/g.64247  ORF Transcript_24427/g.64247 Transcript_24427/m.64247 type:complete len:516 (-) Transcript_24427:19-1566(-)
MTLVARTYKNGSAARHEINQTPREGWVVVQIHQVGGVHFHLHAHAVGRLCKLQTHVQQGILPGRGKRLRLLPLGLQVPLVPLRQILDGADVLPHRQLLSAALAVQQLGLQARHLSLEVVQHGALLCLVLARLGLHLLHTLGEAQRTQVLFVVVQRWRQGGDHHSLGVPTQRILQHERQLRVSERYKVSVLGVPLSSELRQFRDDERERRQTLVNGGSLLETASGRLRLTLPLRTSQIHDIQSRSHLCDDSFSALLLSPRLQREDTVRTTGRCVHASLADGTGLDTKVQQLLHLFLLEHRDVLQTFHIHTHLWVASHRQHLCPCIRCSQEINDLLVVNLHVRGTATEGDGVDRVRRVRDHLVEDLVDDTRKETQQVRCRRTQDTPSLPSTRLPVCEQTTVVTVQGILHHFLPEIIHQVLLRMELRLVVWVERPICSVEGEGLGVCRIGGTGDLLQPNICLARHLNTHHLVHLEFSLVEGTEPNTNFDRTRGIGLLDFRDGGLPFGGHERSRQKKLF